MNATMFEGFWFICLGILIGILLSSVIWLRWLVEEYVKREKRKMKERKKKNERKLLAYSNKVKNDNNK